MTDVDVCGLPTKSGNPCRNRLQPFEIACATHGTDRDRALTRKFRTAVGQIHDQMASAYQKGYEMSESAERRTVEADAELRRNWRDVDGRGRQIVTVGKYAYTWRGAPLLVGDRVVIPDNWLFRAHEGTVTGIGSDYDGPLSEIVSVVERVAA